MGAVQFSIPRFAVSDGRRPIALRIRPPDAFSVWVDTRQARRFFRCQIPVPSRLGYLDDSAGPQNPHLQAQRDEGV
jgi:hypothetical protein